MSRLLDLDETNQLRQQRLDQLKVSHKDLVPLIRPTGRSSRGLAQNKGLPV